MGLVGRPLRRRARSAALALALQAWAPGAADAVVGPLDTGKALPAGEPIARTTVVLPRDEPWRVQNPGWRAFGVGVGVSVLWLDDLDSTELATRVTTGGDTTTIPGDPDEVDRKLSREGHLAAVPVHLPVGLPALSLPAGWRLYSALDLHAHVLFVRLGRVAGTGRLAPYAGVRGRWTRIDIDDTLQLEGADGGGVRIDSETRLEAHLLQAVAGLDARLGGPFYARAEARAGEEGTSALLKLVYRKKR